MYLKNTNIIKTYVYTYTHTKVTLLEAIILQSRATDKSPSSRQEKPPFELLGESERLPK